MSANARIPIDLCDTKVSLPEAQKALEEFMAEASQKHFLDDKRRTIYVANAVYVMINGYLPKENEMTDNKGTQALDGWVPWILYHNTKTYEKIGQPAYPNELDYCNVQGHDLKYSPEAWAATKGLLLTKSTHYAQIVATISSVLLQHFNLDAYPARDRGTFGPLIRFAEMNERYQLRVIAAQQHLKDATDIAVTIIPKDMDQMREHETVIRRIVTLGERSRRLQPGELDCEIAERIARNHLRGGVINSFFNEATRSYTVGKTMGLLESEGKYLTVATLFSCFRKCFHDVNGGHQEELHSMFGSLLPGMTPSSEGSSRIMIAQAKPAPFGDRNGRGTTPSSAEEELRQACIEKDKIIADQANQIAQNRINS